MLAHLLALAVALGSFGVYFSAFFFPEVHRKSDFYWSGLGLFYALVLWVCAGRITGGVLLGQIASVTLLLWFGTQTLILRRLLASPDEKTNISQTIASPFQLLSPTALWQKITGARKQPTQSQSQEKQGQPETPASSATTSPSTHENEKQMETAQLNTQASTSETSSIPTTQPQSQEEKQKSTTAASPSEAPLSLTSESQELEPEEKKENTTEEKRSNQQESESSPESE